MAVSPSVFPRPLPARGGLVRPLLVLVAAAAFVAACSGSRPPGLGLVGERLGDCPSSPNCVSSEATDAGHRVDPLAFAGTPEDGWKAARDAVAAMPRTRIVTEKNGYLHAECTSALMRYVDDLELHLAPGGNAIGVRSASRLGYSDMGVNRRRVESLRSAMHGAAGAAK